MATVSYGNTPIVLVGTTDQVKTYLAWLSQEDYIEGWQVVKIRMFSSHQSLVKHSSPFNYGEMTLALLSDSLLTVKVHIPRTYMFVFGFHLFAI
jgi:hypothetical protein